MRSTGSLVLYANRLPVVMDPVRGQVQPPGGLVTALGPVLRSASGIWVGSLSEGTETPRSLEGLPWELVAVKQTREQHEGHYGGFSNRTLWPALHDFGSLCVQDERWWRSYREVNQLFAEAVPAPALVSGTAQWVHDYHLMLLPGLLRQLRVDSPIAFTLHTPFPSVEAFSRIPWATELLEGMLGADLITLQTQAHKENLLLNCSRLLPEVCCSGDVVTLRNGRRVRLVVAPASIDTEGLAQESTSSGVEREVAVLSSSLGGRRLLLGVDRLDYSKGIPQRLRAVEALFESDPQLLHEAVYVQVAVPTRSDVPEYRALRDEVEREVGRINGRLTSPLGPTPIRYLYRQLPRESLIAHYSLADVGLVTPLKDGMNLVAKEFVSCQHARGHCGSLVLSEFAGAAEELSDALLVNPFDIRATAAALRRAIRMSAEEKRARLAAMAERLRRWDAARWCDATLRAVSAARSSRYVDVPDRRPRRWAAPQDQEAAQLPRAMNGEESLRWHSLT